ncbi:Uncharacterised protein [Serratia quinivorans]|uniref:hypothetical protein n=1 Tax=Serratia quinivorans TaxID=137545 RepID=UPI002179787B|nr:hypothetical protein [Serratia quinivorans]CAI0858395.1 Uncharacterised protein [Serratia quinivorans]
MEIGSLTDWVSSLSTFGTLIVACMAYRKAPEWMAQKHYDVVSKVIEEAVYEDLRKLSSLSFQYKSQIMNTSRILINAIKLKTGSPPNSKEDLRKLENVLMDFFNLSYSIQNRLKAIPRYNYIITPYASNLIDEIKTAADYYNNLQTQFEMAVHESDSMLYADAPAIELTTKEIKDIQRDSITYHRRLSEYIKSVYAENKSIAEFITIKK